MYLESNDIIFNGLEDVNVRNDVFLDLLNHTDHSLKVKIVTPSSIPGLCAPINVSANNSYIISLNILTVPNFFYRFFIFK